MAASINSVTGDLIKSKPNNEAFEQNFERIFGNKKKKFAEDFHDDDNREKAIAQNGNVGYDDKDVLGQ